MQGHNCQLPGRKMPAAGIRQPLRARQGFFGAQLGPFAAHASVRAGRSDRSSRLVVRAEKVRPGAVLPAVGLAWLAFRKPGVLAGLCTCPWAPPAGCGEALERGRQAAWRPEASRRGATWLAEPGSSAGQQTRVQSTRGLRGSARLGCAGRGHRPGHHQLCCGSHGGRQAHHRDQRRGQPHDAQRGGLHQDRRQAGRPGGAACVRGHRVGSTACGRAAGSWPPQRRRVTGCRA